MGVLIQRIYKHLPADMYDKGDGFLLKADNNSSTERLSSFTISGKEPEINLRIIVPPELGYPENDYNKSGPRPTTFSGQRALDFVLRNQGLIDKTLLFDIELIKVATS